MEDTLADPRIDRAMQQVLQGLDILSIVVLPLWAGARQWGVLMFQADVPYAYSEYEHRSLLAMAQQVAVAVENQRLLTETQTTLAELEAIQRRYTVQAWETYRATAKQKGFVKVGETVTPLAEGHLPAEVQEAVVQKKAVVKSDGAANGSTDDQEPSTKMGGAAHHPR